MPHRAPRNHSAEPGAGRGRFGAGHRRAIAGARLVRRRHIPQPGRASHWDGSIPRLSPDRQVTAVPRPVRKRLPLLQEPIAAAAPMC